MGPKSSVEQNSTCFITSKGVTKHAKYAPLGWFRNVQPFSRHPKKKCLKMKITHSVFIQWPSYQNENVCADRNDHGTTTERVGKCTM